MAEQTPPGTREFERYDESRPPMTFSVIPNAEDKRAHAVWDWVIRSAYHDPGRVVLRAVCGTEVHPHNQLPPAAVPCDACRTTLPHDAIPRPAPGSPLLRDMARVHAELTR